MRDMAIGDDELGIVKRLDGDLGYVNIEGKSFAFRPDDIEGFRGEPLGEIGFAEGATIVVVRDSIDHIVKVTAVPQAIGSGTSGTHAPEGLPGRTPTLVPRGFFARAEDTPQQYDVPPPHADQLELHPGTDPKVRRNPGRALPPETRRFGKLIDTSGLSAGDLMLTRSAGESDWISRTISKVQGGLGYGPQDQQWVHVAMYMGDGEHVVEATVDGLIEGGSVRITHLDKYCDGTNILRFRRSKALTQERDGFLVVLKALSKLNEPYSVLGSIKAWASYRLGAVAYEEGEEDILDKCTVCSTLYAYAFNRAHGLSLGEANGISVPAWFSATDKFEDLKVDWVGI